MSSREDERLSQHPVDRLIRHLVATSLAPSDDQIGAILDRLATAPFDHREIRVPPSERGLGGRASTLGQRARSLDYHLIKRVTIDRAWSSATRPIDYVSDLQHVARAASCRLYILRRRGGHLAVAFAPTSQVIPPVRLGQDAQAWVLVVYSADWGIIVTGYQTNDEPATRLPREATWLK